MGRGLWGKDSIDNLIEKIFMEDKDFFEGITRGMTDDEIEDYLTDFPEYRCYWSEKFYSS